MPNAFPFILITLFIYHFLFFPPQLRMTIIRFNEIKIYIKISTNNRSKYDDF